MARTWYEVRVRECTQPPKFVDGKWVSGVYIKKSRFYFTNGPKEAASKYKGNGKIISVEKVGRERLLGIGEFFKLGDKLLEDFKKGGTLLEQVERNKEKRRKRLHYNRKFYEEV
jgi:hypothetical protein